MNGHAKRVLVLTFALIGLGCAMVGLVLRDVDPLASRQFLNAALTALGTAGVIASRHD